MSRAKTMVIRIRYGTPEDKFQTAAELMDFLGESGRAFSHDDLFDEIDQLREKVMKLTVNMGDDDEDSSTG